MMNEIDFLLHCKNTTIKGQAERITELTNQLAQAKEESERMRHAGELLLMCSLPNDVSGVAMINEARAIIRGEAAQAGE